MFTKLSFLSPIFFVLKSENVLQQTRRDTREKRQLILLCKIRFVCKTHPLWKVQKCSFFQQNHSGKTRTFAEGVGQCKFLRDPSYVNCWCPAAGGIERWKWYRIKFAYANRTNESPTLSCFPVLATEKQYALLWLPGKGGHGVHYSFSFGMFTMHFPSCSMEWWLRTRKIMMMQVV